jgi:hypothetical protein
VQSTPRCRGPSARRGSGQRCSPRWRPFCMSASRRTRTA